MFLCVTAPMLSPPCVITPMCDSTLCCLPWHGSTLLPLQHQCTYDYAGALSTTLKCNCPCWAWSTRGGGRLGGNYTNSNAKPLAYLLVSSIYAAWDTLLLMTLIVLYICTVYIYALCMHCALHNSHAVVLFI